MTYKEQAEKAVKGGTVERLTTEIYKFVENDVLIGKFISRELIKSKKKNMPDFYRYFFDTDTGPISVLFSGAFDRDTGAKLRGGCLYQFTHKGTIPISSGHQFKQIETLLLSKPEDEEEEAADDIPI